MDSDKKVNTGCAVIVFLSIASGIPSAIEDNPIVLAPLIAIFGLLVAYGIASIMYNTADRKNITPIKKKEVPEETVLEEKKDTPNTEEVPNLSKLGLEEGCTLEELCEVTEEVQIYSEEENIYYNLQKPFGFSISDKARNVPVIYLSASTKKEKYTPKYIASHRADFALIELNNRLIIYKISECEEWEEL